MAGKRNMAGGKAGKDSKPREQAMSRSMRAGLQFPVGRIHRFGYLPPSIGAGF